MTRAVAIFSGGIDSTTLLYSLREQRLQLSALTFDYGQRHSKEIDAARMIATHAGIEHHVVDLRALRPLFGRSSLTDETVPIPNGSYTADSMKVTVVPNRNGIMLDIAVAHAVATGATLVAFGAHAGDHFIYPDCRPTYVDAFEKAARLGNEGFANPDLRVVAPFSGMTKVDIVRLAVKLRVPLASTWSCYVGAKVHCGLCGTCNERIEAFREADVPDPTAYAATLMDRS